MRWYGWWENLITFSKDFLCKINARNETISDTGIIRIWGFANAFWPKYQEDYVELTSIEKSVIDVGVKKNVLKTAVRKQKKENISFLSLYENIH